MRIVFNSVALLAALFVSIVSYSQNAVIDYQAWNPSNPPCNIFGGGVNVPATVDGNGTSINHGSLYGQPKYNTSVKAVELPVEYVNASDTRGTQYRFAYNFKQNYSYDITVSAAERTSTQGTGKTLYLRLAISNSSGSANPPCDGPDNRARDVGGAQAITGGANYEDYPFTFNALAIANPSLDITAYSGYNGGANAVRIRKITITEIAPQVSFTLAPSLVSIQCGSTTPQTFTVANIYSTSGVTGYTWNLGSANNGWLYNGSAAPQTITTTTNTLTLTPVCGATQTNVSATVTAGGNNFQTNTAAVTVTLPSLTVNGAAAICSGSEVYTVSNLPCNASVSWSALPSGNVSITTGGNSATLNKAGNGTVTLTATVTSCGTPITISKAINVGYIEPAYLDYTSDDRSCYELALETADILGASYYWWAYKEENGATSDFVHATTSSPIIKLPLAEMPGIYRIGVTVTNACGEGLPLSRQIEIECLGMYNLYT